MFSVQSLQGRTGASVAGEDLPARIRNSKALFASENPCFHNVSPPPEADPPGSLQPRGERLGELGRWMVDTKKGSQSPPTLSRGRAVFIHWREPVRGLAPLPRSHGIAGRIRQLAGTPSATLMNRMPGSGDSELGEAGFLWVRLGPSGVGSGEGR